MVSEMQTEYELLLLLTFVTERSFTSSPLESLFYVVFHAAQ